MIKRVTLINPNFLLRNKFNFDRTYPLGLAYIAAILEKNYFKVNIIDANALDMSSIQVVEALRKAKPDMVGISCNFSPLHNPALEIAAYIKKVIDIPIVVGGNHASGLKEIFINDKNVDFVIKGEAEYAFLDLATALNSGKDLNSVQGLIFKNGKAIVETGNRFLIENLDSLPLPAYHLLPMDTYERYSIMTGRGCPFNCSFCASKVIFGQKVRMRSVENVVSEIEHLVAKYGQRTVWFCDDTFTVDERYVLGLCNLIKEKKLNISWRCHTHVAKVSDKALNAMKDAGCFCVVYGVESGNQRILSKMKKTLSRTMVIDAIMKTKKAGMDAAAFFMVGTPGENLESIIDSYRLIYESHLTAVSFCITLPLPGTELFRELLAKKIINIKELNWDCFFARIPGHRDEEYYAASLASKYCGLNPDLLIRACLLGDKIPSLNSGFDEEAARKMLISGR